MVDFNGKVVVITGAAHGLGEATARAFADRGARLALCDIDGIGLRKVQDVLEDRGVRSITGIVDVTDPKQFEQFSELVFEEFGRVDILVNNAGVMLAGLLCDMTLEDWRWIVNINLLGVIHGTHLFYPRMKERGSGHIVNVASAAGLIPLPMLSAYSGTKSAVLAMTRVWRAEGAAHGVGFTAICPSIMNTNVKESFRICVGSERRPPSEDLVRKAGRFLATKRFDPSTVAETIVRAIEKNRSVVPVGPGSHLFDLTDRLSRRFVDLILRVSTRLGERMA